MPVLGQCGVSDVHIDSLQVLSGGPPAWLQSSPEYFLKRLLAAYPLSCYSLGKAFREGESGARHHREFSLLEWYRPGWDEHRLMEEVAGLLFAVGLDREVEVQRFSYHEIFFAATGLDPYTETDASLRTLATELSRNQCADYPRSTCLDLIFSLRVEPNLPEGLVFIYNYPEVQAALSRIDRDGAGKPIARRFEAFLNRMEIANGYWELCDAEEQRRRFEADNRSRIELGKQVMPVDEKILAALDKGLPECAGVALGVDRVLMHLLGAKHIGEVLSFSELPK